ncbi:uncharacterized protein LOC115891208 [Sitophilus oryzae]|uniref:Uncharacterized protein LOC115891208 n=1 Tax=Sitophilus oryzae TaxID=7048 RepID=A0A6J2YTR8_SITOR|nr:uncharacterized protein LOC115891208 [Sitophilus oryzae]
MEKFVKATSNNLPRVDIFMVHELLKRDNRFNSAEIAGVKASSSTRESYGDNARGYVEFKKEGPLCSVKARICPEHKVRSKAYTIETVINEEEETFIDVCCKDCAAGEGIIYTLCLSIVF